MDAVIVIDENIDLSKFDLSNKYIIGVEKGALNLINSGFKDFTVISDFDSLDKQKVDKIYLNCKNIIKLNTIKDYSDTYYAYKLCDKCENILILGGIHGLRVDHLIANINILANDNRVKFTDDFCTMFSFKDSIITFTKSIYKYYSFYAFTKSIISLKGFKYNIEDYSLKPYDSLCLSNELDSKEGILELKQGNILIIESKDDINR